MAEIHEQFFRSHRALSAIGDATARVEKTIGTVTETLSDSGHRVSKYGCNLTDFVRAAEGASPTDLQRLAGDILAETQQMASESEQLQERLVAAGSEIQRLRHDLDEVRREALTDGLTGLANRKAFDLALAQQVSHCLESGEPFALLMLDIDHFKQFNDSFGHQLGDGVLRLVGRTLLDSVKGRDHPARYGGEEFAVILRATALQGALAVAEQIRHAIAQKKIVRRATNEELGRLTISIGCAQYRLGEPIRELIRRADHALYAAKRLGRNRVAAEYDVLPDGAIAE
ncbi:MAG: GGDEF domain-containing protein [Alphaproteobacteria bacterium]|nr:GGDEF domain-containing protein [Alphaproteobacteria bacterium]